MKVKMHWEDDKDDGDFSVGWFGDRTMYLISPNLNGESVATLEISNSNDPKTIAVCGTMEDAKFACQLHAENHAVMSIRD
jgi:hypothetical protein